jgi:hypothetical protein
MTASNAPERVINVHLDSCRKTAKRLVQARREHRAVRLAAYEVRALPAIMIIVNEIEEAAARLRASEPE